MVDTVAMSSTTTHRGIKTQNPKMSTVQQQRHKKEKTAAPLSLAHTKQCSNKQTKGKPKLNSQILTNALTPKTSRALLKSHIIFFQVGKKEPNGGIDANGCVV